MPRHLPQQPHRHVGQHDPNLAYGGTFSLPLLADAPGIAGGQQVLLGSYGQLSVGTDNTNQTFSGVISGYSSSLTKVGTGMWTLNAPNTYTGATTVTAGTLQYGAGIANAIPSGPGVGNATVNGTLDVNGNSPTINGLNGSGTVDNTLPGSPVTLTIGGNNANGSFGGTIQNSGGALSLIKTGSGTQTISGNNTYGGTTTVAAGTLLAVTPASLPHYASAGTVSVASGATLAVQVNTNGSNGFSSGQLDTVLGVTTWTDSTSALGIDTTQGTFTYGTNITQTIGLSKLGANTLILTGTNTYPGVTTVKAGTLQIGDGTNGAWNAASSVSVASGATLCARSADSGGSRFGHHHQRQRHGLFLGNRRRRQRQLVRHALAAHQQRPRARVWRP